MYLKRLELQGFKSFPDKIRLDFNKGITAVVGPNGSGKSNVSDAIRWVLGEQSAKNLRGAKMEDVIFAGTQSRKSLGFAEVAMTIDNSDKKLNLDFSEITVSRRVYRSGESQFRINDSVCRLKDIHELFMDTGIGREGYSIIGQGRIDEILSSKSEERRLLFEEAAGIVKFKNRKQEAEAKLERERQNLIRVNDIVMELEAQVQPLFVQSEKAKSFIEYSKHQKIIETNIFIDEVSKFEKDIETVVESISNLKEHIEAEIVSQNEKRQLVNKTKEDIILVEEEIQNKNSESAETRSLIEKKEAQIQLNKERIQHANLNIEKITRDVGAKQQTIENYIASKNLYSEKLSSAMMDIEARTSTLKILQDDYDFVNQKLVSSEEQIEQYTTEHIEKLRNTSEAEGRIQRSKGLLEQLKSREKQVSDDCYIVESRAEEQNVKLLVKEKELAEKEASANEYELEIEKLSKDLEQCQEELSELNHQYSITNRKREDNKSKAKLLTELEDNYEGFYKSVKAVLGEKKRNPDRFTGIHGAVVELLKVPKEFEVAIEIALGGSLQNIVTQTERDAQMAIEFLKQRKEGRSTFLPLNTIKPKDLGGIKEKIAEEKGFVGIAVDLIQFDNTFSNIFSNLLGKVIVVDNLDNGILLAKKYSHQYKVVTVDGDILNTGGSLTGGSLNRGQSNIISRGGEITLIKEEIIEYSKQLENISVLLNNATAKFSEITENIGKLKIFNREIEIAKMSMLSEISQLKINLNQLEEERHDYEIEKRQLKEQIDNAEKEIENLVLEHEKIEEQIKEIVTGMDKKQSSVQEDRNRRDLLGKDLTNIKVEISAMESNLVSVKENITRLNSEIKTTNTEINVYENEITQLNLDKEKLEQDIINIKTEITEEKERQSSFYNHINNLTQKKENLKLREEELEKENLLNIEKTAELRNDLNRLELKKENLETNMRKLYDDMWETYNITYQQALKEERLELSRSQLLEEQKSVKDKIRNLGNVNVGAIEEYKNVKERFDFLTKQRDDIIDAENKLLEIIEQLRELVEKQFYDQFKLISENFGIVFKEMFEGGTAYLKLSDENDVLGSGIEIISQPPGKNLQNMSLFSGGERALTAIALLFAILRMKPSPFCILDEIEAALDDANVARYANYLKKFSHETQFIVITHRKGTMEAADILYGVTMQEQGVSKLVSVNFADDEK